MTESNYGDDQNRLIQGLSPEDSHFSDVSDQHINTAVFEPRANQEGASNTSPLNLGDIIPNYNDGTQVETQAPEEKRKWGKKLGVILAAGSLALAGTFALTSDGNESKAHADSSSISKEIMDALSIKKAEVLCADIGKKAGTVGIFDRDEGIVDDFGVKPEVGALKPVGKGAFERRWSDAIEAPLTHKNLTEIQATVCEDPLFGATLANMFASMKIGDVKVVDLNKEWLGDFEGSSDTINDNAKKYLPQGIDGVSQNEAEAALQANKDYEGIANKLNTLLTRFKNEGVQVKQTALNYHLVAGGLVAGGLPEVGINPKQYKGEFIVLKLDEKSGDCLEIIGFNTMDQRPASFVCSVPTKPGTPGKPGKPGQPGGQGGKPGFTPKPGPSGSTPQPTVGPKVESCPDGRADYLDDGVCNSSVNSGPGAGGTPSPEGTQSTAPQTQEPTPQPTSTYEHGNTNQPTAQPSPANSSNPGSTSTPTPNNSNTPPPPNGAGN